MKHTVAIGILILIVLHFLACKQAPQQATRVDEEQDLKKTIKEEITAKKELEQLKIELSRGHLSESIAQYKPIIKKYSKRYGFDWRLITAQIVQESGFKIQARSRVGAHGLMQIMPGTAQEISRELNIEYIMKNPRENITAGIYHLHKQMRYFPDADHTERTKLALASYNSGVGRVFDAQDIARYYQRSHNYWSSVRPYLSMLKASDWQLHLQVWPQGRPLYGYFYGYNETINYVDNIWVRYQAYIKLM